MDYIPTFELSPLLQVLEEGIAGSLLLICCDHLVILVNEICFAYALSGFAYAINCFLNGPSYKDIDFLPSKIF
jgi:hypothetical protein